MFDPMDNIQAEWDSPGGRRAGSRMRWILSRQSRKWKLVKFAKDFLLRYLNSGLDVEDVLDELHGWRERGEYMQRMRAIRFAKDFLHRYLNSSLDVEEVVEACINY